MRLRVIYRQCPGQIGQIGQFVRAWGIATETLRPDARATVTTPRGAALNPGDQVVTVVARNLEPCRGFHIFMRARRCIQQTDPRCHALSVGGEEEEASHGTRPFGGAGNDVIFGDGVARAGTLQSVPSAQHGNDVLMGGAGTDKDCMHGEQSARNRVILPQQFDGNDLTDTPADIRCGDCRDGYHGNDRRKRRRKKHTVHTLIDFRTSSANDEQFPEAA